jgi:hypothetical protein
LNSLKITISIILSLLVPLGSLVAGAGPSLEWDSAGVPITAARGLQLRGVGTTDGAGGAILVWEDHRGNPGNPDIYGQRVNNAGANLWEKNGKSVVAARNLYGGPASQSDPTVVSDGTGGAILAWLDDRTLQGDIFAQRINASGKKIWKSSGVPIATACYANNGICANGKSKPEMTRDGAGGAIITWYEVRDGFHLSVWAQRVNAKGISLWAKDGVPVANGSFYASTPKIVTDGRGGAIIAWQDDRAGVGDQIYAQHLDGNGVPKWALNGIKVSPNIGHAGPLGHSIISDGAHGAIIAWVDARDVTKYEPTICVQRLNQFGQPQWNRPGVKVSKRAGGQDAPVMVGDGAGGAIIAWQDTGAAPPGSGQTWVFVQRINSRGIRSWTGEAIPVCTYQGFSLSITSDQKGGAIVVWDGMRPLQGPSIFAQRVSGSGQKLWDAEGFEIYHQPQGSYGFEPRSVSDGRGGVIVFWKDYRSSSTFWDMFAQRMVDQS